MDRNSKEYRDNALKMVLVSVGIRSEDGTRIWTDFTEHGRDGKDFADIAVWTLKYMMEAAYEAGRASKD